MRLKEETGTVKENTRYAFTEYAKTDYLFFISLLSPLLCS